MPPAAGYPAAGGYPAPGTPLQYSASPTNVLAVISLVAGICGLTVVPVFGAVTAIVTGHVARSQTARTGENGRVLATVGLCLGYVGLVRVIAAIGLILVLAGRVISVTSAPSVATLSVG